VRLSVLPKPYAGFVLNSVKNLEMPWWPMLHGHRHCTLAIHMVYQDWKDSVYKGPWAGNWWHKVPDHHSGPQSPFVLEAEARLGLHMALVCLVVIGGTLLCLENLGPSQVQELENQALLPDLQQKYMTALANPRWLLQPVPGRGRKDIFQVDIPQHLIL
ncbi:hypothetical protein M91_05333, partial [Bos mutus]